MTRWDANRVDGGGGHVIWTFGFGFRPPSRGGVGIEFSAAIQYANICALTGEAGILALAESRWFGGSIMGLRAAWLVFRGMFNCLAILRNEFIFDW